jgi:hypothetical protein
MHARDRDHDDPAEPDVGNVHVERVPVRRSSCACRRGPRTDPWISRFFGLRPWANFKEWNPDPAINVSANWIYRMMSGLNVCLQEAAQALYGDIEHLELHGLFSAIQAMDTVLTHLKSWSASRGVKAAYAWRW